MPRIQLHDSFQVFITVISHLWVFLDWNISTEAPDHRKLGANSIIGKLGNFATYGANMGIKYGSLEIGRNHDLFMFNQT